MNDPAPAPRAALARRVERLRAGDASTLARAITAVERGTAEGMALLGALQPLPGRALSVGFTGPPGAGKSTLISACVAELRRRDLGVGVIAVDPSSPLTGGAVLGDRIRMAEHAGDPGVFIRSLAARGHLGGLAVCAAQVADLMDAAGRDVVILETVGTGQSEVEIAEVAQVRVVVCAPGLGDEVQAIKAGVLEIADLLVVNKADLPLAGHTVRQLRAMLALRPAGRRDVPVLTTSATRGEGAAAVFDALAEVARIARADPRRGDRQRRTRQLLAMLAAERLRARLLAREDTVMRELCRALERGEIDYERAVTELLG